MFSSEWSTIFRLELRKLFAQFDVHWQFWCHQTRSFASALTEREGDLHGISVSLWITINIAIHYITLSCHVYRQSNIFLVYMVSRSITFFEFILNLAQTCYRKTYSGRRFKKLMLDFFFSIVECFKCLDILDVCRNVQVYRLWWKNHIQ